MSRKRYHFIVPAEVRRRAASRPPPPPPLPACRALQPHQPWPLRAAVCAQVGPDSLQDPTSLPALVEALDQGRPPPAAAVALPASHADRHAAPYCAPTGIFDSTKHRLHGEAEARGAAAAAWAGPGARDAANAAAQPPEPKPDALSGVSPSLCALARAAATAAAEPTPRLRPLLSTRPPAGVLHSNGFGHLLRVNGREGGSRRASGRQLMELWDGLCARFRARLVSVEDVSNKVRWI